MSKKTSFTAREPGFYIVSGICNVLEAVTTEQPAYWTGTHWVILGWECHEADHPDYKVIRKLDINQ